MAPAENVNSSQLPILVSLVYLSFFMRL